MLERENAAIRVENLTRDFRPPLAVRSLTFTVMRGEVFGLIGSDGAGKTTTMRMLASIMEPTAGDAWVGGYHTVENAEMVKEKTGYMAQRFGLYSDLTVMENINFYADIYGVPGRVRRERIERLISFANLGAFKNRLAGALSGGMKQKLGLVCALVHTPEVLLLDEPTNGVDPVSRRDFWRILNELVKQGVTVFFSTAYFDEAERCSRIALLEKGRLLALGTPAGLKTLVKNNVLQIRLLRGAREAAGILKEVFGPTRVALFGDRLHLTVASTEEARKIITEKLGADFEMGEFREIEPTLEDVFVSIMTGTLSDRNVSGEEGA